MNVDLISNDINLDFYFHPSEILKSDEDIKIISFNSSGTIIAIVTKSNTFKLFDFLGKIIISSFNYFKESEKVVTSISWTNQSESIVVSYESKNGSVAGIKRILLNLMDPKNLFVLNDVNLEFTNTKIKEVKVHSLQQEDDILFISGDFPKIYFLKTGEVFDFFPKNESEEGERYTYILKETVEPKSFFLFVKELYLIFLVKERIENHLNKNKFLMENLGEKNLNENQMEEIEWVVKNLVGNLVIVDIFGIPNNVDINSVQFNSLKNLILVNSTDKYLRLFKYDFDNITLLRDYTDSVNRKKWVNAHFYTFKVKNTFQDLILSALQDVNSLEFIFIDIETGNFIKRLEPYKYQCTDFICHYHNHFTIVINSSKKLFNIFGFLVNNWSAFAPQFKYIEENIEFIEDEAFFDNFNKNLKKKQIQDAYDKSFIRSIFKSDSLTKKPAKSMFVKFTLEENDALGRQCEEDLKEIFQQFGEIMEINKHN